MFKQIPELPRREAGAGPADAAAADHDGTGGKVTGSDESGSNETGSDQAVAPPAEADPGADRWRWRERFGAAGLHLGVSLAVAAAVLAIVYLVWYPSPLGRITGIGPILVMLLAVDVVIGPLLTLLVFDRRKKSLPFDLACIATVQVAALGYGLHAVEGGRPHYLVFAVDRFEVISRVDLEPESLAAAASNPAAARSLAGPAVVGVERPTDPDQQREILFEAALGGRDLQHHPERYRDLKSFQAEIARRALPLTELKRLNPQEDGLIEAAIIRSGHADARAAYLPIRGPKGAAAMLVDQASGELLGMVDLAPWE